MQIYKLRESGTHGRVWKTDEENNIAFSFFIQTDCKAEKIEGITIEIAENILQTFKEMYNIELEIKYPNDIVFRNKKIGGILTEAKIKGDKVKCLVIGIGINTNQETFAVEIKDIASSIKNEFNIKVDNKKVIEKICEIFENKIIERNIIK